MILKNEQIYNGDHIHSRFAYKYLRKDVNACGDIVSFVGPMNVTTNLIDLEDSLNNDFIYSKLAFNFIWEIPNLCPIGAVAFQRLFNTHIANILSFGYLKKAIEVDGDDLIVHDSEFPKNSKYGDFNKGKCSVSITISKDNVTLGHTGINIIAGKSAPDFAYSTNILSEEDQVRFMTEVENHFYNLVQDLFCATTKVCI